MTQSLLFDETLELCDPSGVASGGSYWFEALADGATFGDPEPVEVAIGSLLLDGIITETQSQGNREASFLIRVKATDSQGLAEGIAALRRSVGKRTTLEWTPPDGFGATTVFRVETSSLHSPGGFDDLALKRNEQQVVLRLVCLPYAYSATSIIDDAGTPPSSGTVVLNCESTTGWAVGSTMTYPAEYVVDTTIFAEGARSVRSRIQSYRNDVTPTQSNVWDKVSGLNISTGTGGYLSVAFRVEWTMQSYRLFMTSATGGRVEITSAVAVKRDANGFVHYAWPVAAGLTITALEFVIFQTGPTIASLTSTTAPPHHVWYDDVEFAASATTEHQIVKQHNVQGSARTTGSLHIASPTASVGLGQVLAITVPTDELPAGFQPDGRRWVTQGTPTTDATAPDGSYYTPSATAYDASAGKPIFDVPVGMLTAGPYRMVALLQTDTTSVSGVQAQLRLNGANVGPVSVAETTPDNLILGWKFVVLGTCYLPPLPTQNADTSAKVRLLFKGAKVANVYMIPAWQVGGRPVADFSIVNCGTGAPAPGGSSSSLWIDSPSTDQPQGGWWRGPTPDRANAQSAWPDAKWPGVHAFNPGSLTAFVVSTGAQGPTSTLEYFPAWHGAAAS